MKELRQIFQHVNELITRDDWDIVWDFLKSKGFSYLSSGSYSTAYLHKDWGVVFKVSGDEEGVNVPDTDRFPFLRKYWVKPLFQSYAAMIQPLVDTSRACDAQREIAEDLAAQGILSRHAGDAPFDMHDGNVGHWRGRAVAFDILSRGQWLGGTIFEDDYE